MKTNIASNNWRHVVEALESRIAPARFFVSGTSLQIFDSAGIEQLGDAAATAAGVTKALLLNPGDKVFYDLNGDHMVGAGDVRWMVVTAGRAMTFFNDVNASGQFDLSEFTGIAVGDGVKATIRGEVNGSIATGLNAMGQFDVFQGQLNLDALSSIAGLTITGHVKGDIVAGNAIKNVRVNDLAFAHASDASVSGKIATGTAARGLSESFDGTGATPLTMFYVQRILADGGKIKNVTLANGASAILTGNGRDVLFGDAGRGGNISGLTILHSPVATLVQAGAGGSNTGMSGNGGAGGTVTNATIKTESAGALQISSGAGGNAAAGEGGAGGAVSYLTITALGDSSSLAVSSGAGGNGGGAGTGGQGGFLTTISVTTAGIANGVNIFSGAGGNGGTTANADGGNSGSLNDITIHDRFAGGGPISIYAGAGGKGQGSQGKGGGTGSITFVTLDALHSDVRIGSDSHPAGDGIKGGDAGSISEIAGRIGTLVIEAGDGGRGIAGIGGKGGNVSFVNIARVGDFVRAIKAGNGGIGVGVPGGDGGTVANIFVAGDIGDFSSAFDVASFATGMGGIVAGQGGVGSGAIPGANGSILNVNADRIAAMIAGRPAANALTAGNPMLPSNAVTMISGIVANVIGADINDNRAFDFTDAGPVGFNLGDGDTALDGLVVVKRGGGGAALAAKSLKLIKV